MASSVAVKRPVLNRIGMKIVLHSMRRRNLGFVHKVNIDKILASSKALDELSKQVQKSFESDNKGGPIVDALGALVKYILDNPEKVLALIAGIIKLFAL